MYENFLEKNLNSIRQAIDDSFIAKYADLSYAELTTLWQEVGLGSYCDGMIKIINPSDYQDVMNSAMSWTMICRFYHSCAQLSVMSLPM